MRATELELASTVPLTSMRRYLVLHGWRKIEDAKPGMDLFQKSIASVAEVEILLPQHTGGQDTIRRIGDALRTLSQISEEGLEETAASVRAVAVDILRSTVPDALVRYESIHLDVASNFIKDVKALLSAAATTELAPEPFFGRVRKEAKAYADECRFGHTFRGSFGFSIESPVVANTSPTIEVVEQTPPFERRVMERLARGLRSVQVALTEQDAAQIFDNYRTGFSANVCEELIGLVESIKGERVGFEFSFSPEWRVPLDIRGSVRYEIAANHVELVKDAAKRLRLQEFERNRVIRGRVVRLKSDRDPSDLLNPTGAREITVQWMSEDFGEINVKITLPPEQYLQAVEAHKNGRSISVAGHIERIGRTWVLMSPTAFNVLL